MSGIWQRSSVFLDKLNSIVKSRGRTARRNYSRPYYPRFFPNSFSEPSSLESFTHLCGIITCVTRADGLKESVLRKKRDTSAGARRPYIVDVVFAGASERDLEGKFCARHFEMNAEHRRISRKPASIRAHLLFSFHGALSAILLSCLSAKLIKRSMPRENRQGSISSTLASIS